MGVITEPVGSFAWVGSLQQGVTSPIVASANAMPAPVSSVYHVSGTTLMKTIDLPWPNFTGRVTLIADAGMNWDTSGTNGTPNALSRKFGAAGTSAAGKAVTFVSDGAAWYPDVISAAG